MRGARLLGIALVGLSFIGCERKAPGPFECARFAESVVRASGGGFISPRMQEQVEEETRQCLTRPYDRALLACVEVTGHAHACLERYRQRTGQPL